jgi:2-polyprenyl-6-methoxyphenol hydroxylase-like FAD-dependent oxidoreductase
MASSNPEVVVVGAGPVGLIIALNLVRQGIKVTLLETFNEIIQSPRAMGYGPAGVAELERAGIAQECRDLGMDESDYEYIIRWITIDNKPIASLESSLVKGRPPPVVCGQHLVAGVILKHLETYKEATVLWNHKVVGIEQDDTSVTAVCETDNGPVRVTGQYLIGADGARSTVRKEIGCTFDGFTYDKMVVATNVYYPFRENGFHRGQFIVHPEHFALVYSHICVNPRLQKSQKMGCIEFRTAKTRVSRLKRHAPIWKTNTTQCSPGPSQSPASTICGCFHRINYINEPLINSELDVFY